MGMPESDTAVLTGRVKPDERTDLWRERRIFYCTPQTVQKDLEASITDAEQLQQPSKAAFASQVVCLILDEAHKASGNYAYTKVVELLESRFSTFSRNLYFVQGQVQQHTEELLEALADEDEDPAQVVKDFMMDRVRTFYRNIGTLSLMITEQSEKDR